MTTAAELALGVDVSTLSGGVFDIDAEFRTITGARAVAECIARGLVMPRGKLVDIGDEPSLGFDLRTFTKRRVDARTLWLITQGVQREADADDRVESVDVKVQWIEQSSTLRVDIEGTTAAGPFAVVLSASELTVEVLRIEP